MSAKEGWRRRGLRCGTCDCRISQGEIAKTLPACVGQCLELRLGISRSKRWAQSCMCVYVYVHIPECWSSGGEPCHHVGPSLGISMGGFLLQGTFRIQLVHCVDTWWWLCEDEENELVVVGDDTDCGWWRRRRWRSWCSRVWWLLLLLLLLLLLSSWGFAPRQGRSSGLLANGGGYYTCQLELFRMSSGQNHKHGFCRSRLTSALHPPARSSKETLFCGCRGQRRRPEAVDKVGMTLIRW